MSITDELRKWWVHKYPVIDEELHKDFTAIVNRIDAEHESACAEAYGNGVMSVPIALDESAYVELPKDADGVPIRFGDKVTVSWNKKVYEVSGFSYTQQLASGKRTVCVDVYNLEKLGNVPLCAASSCRHYKPPTVEDVMVEFATDWESAQDGEDKAAVLKEYAEKFQLRGESE